MKISFLHLLVVLFVLIFLGCATGQIVETSLSRIDYVESKDIIQLAWQLFEQGSFQETIDVLSPVIGRHSAQNIEAESHYLLGKGYFQLAVTNMSRFRGKYPVGMGGLPQEIILKLNKSRFHFEQAGDTAPNGPYAAESYYLAGLSLDYGYLQEFEKAQEIYYWTMKTYPDSQYGKMSRERYEEIEKKTRGLGDMPNGK
jgi:tetratricopeptide (TPR) repeat protein